jgi:hypothetical protein
MFYLIYGAVVNLTEELTKYRGLFLMYEIRNGKGKKKTNAIKIQQ